MHYKLNSLGRKFNILLDTGEDILTVVRDIITKENVENGIIVSGLGVFIYYTLNEAVFRMTLNIYLHQQYIPVSLLYYF